MLLGIIETGEIEAAPSVVTIVLVILIAFIVYKYAKRKGKEFEMEKRNQDSSRNKG